MTMDEATAHKILLWLCNRWKKRIEKYYKKLTANSKPDEIVIEFLDNDLWVMEFDGTINLKFAYHFKRDYSLSSDMYQIITDELMLREEECGHVDYIAVPLFSTLETDADLLKFLFNAKNYPDATCDNIIYVKNWAGEAVCFIDKNESLEEVMVKADLEEVS